MSSTETTTTPFSDIYDSFFGRITDDMYMELTEVDTKALAQELLLNGMYRFEFPRFNIYDYVEGHKETIASLDADGNQKYDVNNEPLTEDTWVGGYFNSALTREEINILAITMIVEWLGQQLAATDNTRLQYSGSDFKFSSQANHMSKLKVLIDKYETECFHLQRLYKRRRVDDGKIISNFDTIMTSHVSRR